MTNGFKLTYRFSGHCHNRRRITHWDIPIQVKKFPNYDLILIFQDHLKAGWAIEKVLKAFLWEYHLQPERVICLSQVSAEPEYWDFIQATYQQREYLFPSWRSVSQEILLLVQSGEILPEPFTLIKKELCPATQQAFSPKKAQR